MIKISKGLLSFLSGLGFMGLGFYIVFFAFVDLNYQILGNYLLLFSIVNSVLACVVVYFLAIAFSFTEGKIEVNATQGGFIGGILSMVAIILMIVSFRMDDLGLMSNLTLMQRIHPLISFFLASACTILLIWPEEGKEEKW